MTKTMQTRRRWRPWQFSLRALVLWTLCVACFFGGWTANEWKRQRELEAIKALTPPQVQASQFEFYVGLAR
jgi:hypothetical protein